jgi:HEAT repeat protein
VKDLMTEVARFREWASNYPHAWQPGEWECDYEGWPDFCDAVLGFVAQRQFASWSEAEVRAVLYAIARDNELQYLAETIGERWPDLIPPLAEASLQFGERDDRWQLAVELGRLGSSSETLLLRMARDSHEYVRRMALQSLVSIGSPMVEQLALAAWHRSDEHQEWARMMSLHCLSKIGSPSLDSLLTDAERDERQLLREYAERIRRGESLE